MLIIHAAAIGSFRRWLRLRAERKPLLSATDQLSRLPDDVLGDIGISRDEIMCALSRAIRHAEAGAADTTIEPTRIAWASIPKRLAAGSGYASAEIPFGWSTSARSSLTSRLRQAAARGRERSAPL
ncbi:MAG: DUF1127 domain-containing protein [Mesorhizobium sp.]|nr:MAG: DUF1127 domain-containing protein [Mesorhizobium sp.]